MEGKAVLFKKFAAIDVFDIEIAAETVESMVSTISALEPTFGGINLEDIKAPECFEVERQLREKMNIRYSMTISMEPPSSSRQPSSMAWSLPARPSITSRSSPQVPVLPLSPVLNLLVSLGAKRENIWVHDIEGLVYEGRNTLMDPWKEIYAQKKRQARSG